MSAITDFLDYSTKSPGARSRLYRVQVSPNTGAQTLNPGDVIRLDVPCGRGRNVFLDPTQSYFSFQVVNNDTANPITIDGSGYAFLNRYDELSSGQLITTILDYNAAITAVLDAQMIAADAVCSGSVAMGMGQGTGQEYNVDRSGTVIAAGKTADFCLPVALSGLFSGLCPKLLPVGIMPDARIEITLAANLEPIVGNAGTLPANNPWTIKDFKLNLFYLDLDASVSDMIHQANGGVYKISTEMFRSFATVSSSASHSSDSILVPIRVSSLKTLMMTYRASADITSATNYYVSNRYNPWADSTNSGLKCSVQFALGSVLEPNQPITYGVSELYTMLLQSQHSLGSVNQANRMSLTNWTNNAEQTSGQLLGTAMAAVNLESFIFKTKSITCGANTLTSPVFFNTSYPQAQNTVWRINSIAHYDALVSISDQGVDVRF